MVRTVNALLLSLLPASADSELAAWVPAPLLAIAVVGMGVWIWRQLSRRLDKIEAAIEGLHKYATTEQLGSMGDRFDERIGGLRERVARLEGERDQ